MSWKYYLATILVIVSCSAACADSLACVPPTLDCTPQQNCDLHTDTRECNRCLASAFSHCIVHGNDPGCEAAKASQNAEYEAQKTQCEAQKSQQKLNCEATKAALATAYS